MTSRVSSAGVDIERVEAELRPLQMDLMSLAMQGKQLHWNIQGRLFMSIHEQLDMVVNDARLWVDEIAERLVTLGVSADGQPSDVARESNLPEVPRGAISDSEALNLITERVGKLAREVRVAAGNLDEVDIASQDICIGILKGLEKHEWMLRSQKA